MKPIVDTMRDIFMAVFYGWIAAIIVIYLLKASNQSSRLFMLLLMPTALFNICVVRYAVMKFLKRKNLFTEKVILVGAGKTAERIVRFWNEDLGYRYDIVGILDDKPISETLPKRFPIIGGFNNLKNVVKVHKVNTVIIAAPGLSKENLQNLITKIQNTVEHISFIPDLIGTPMASVEPSILFTEEILMLNLKNNLASPYNRFFKRIFDLILTILGGLLISPILIILAIIVAIDNRGRVIFAHRRVGIAGKHFNCYKFQTMKQNFDLQKYLDENPDAKKEWEETFKLTNDPRVTKLGAILRKTSLDELPQLFNVLTGEMSLVGPRPIVDAEINRYGKFIREYFMVPPGITGFWQVSGRSDTTYEERVEMDTWYVRNWSVWIDILYLFKTIKAVTSGKGAY
jgi:undecaprenyl-phosphate galactose phosphotransferase